MQLDLTGDLDSLKYISEGVLYFNEVPVYMIERLQTREDDVLFVYGVRKDESGNPIKDFYVKERIVRKDGKQNIRGGNYISDTLIQVIPHKKEKYTETKPPLYVAPVVEYEETGTEEFGTGFFVRVPDDIDANGKVREHGYPTGVFILTKHIEWYNHYVPIDGLVEEYMFRAEERDYLRGRGNERL